jgi:hypothetical protein
VSDDVVGNCLHLYLQNYALLWSLEEQGELPPDLKDEEKLLMSFSERASEQAAALLESLYTQLVLGDGLPYRTDRRSQKKTVRDQWYMEGPFFRPRERTAHNGWSLSVGCFKDKGPTACMVLFPWEPESTAPLERLSIQTAALFGFESANASSCFAHDSGHQFGLLIGAALLNPSTTHDVAAGMIREHIDLFFSKLGPQFDEALAAT